MRREGLYMPAAVSTELRSASLTGCSCRGAPAQMACNCNQVWLVNAPHMRWACPLQALRHEPVLAAGMDGLQLGQQPQTAAEGAWDHGLLPEAASGVAAQQAGEGGDDLQHGRGQPAEQALAAAEEQASGAAAERATREQAPKPVATSAHALGALWELVQCCIGAQPLPEAPAWEATHMASGPAADTGASAAPAKPDESGSGRGSSQAAAAAAPELGGAAAEGSEPALPGEQALIPVEAEQPCSRAPQVQWYDARARVALKQVAAWLQVSRRWWVLPALCTAGGQPV